MLEGEVGPYGVHREGAKSREGGCIGERNRRGAYLGMDADIHILNSVMVVLRPSAFRSHVQGWACRAARPRSLLGYLTITDLLRIYGNNFRDPPAKPKE